MSQFGQDAVIGIGSDSSAARKDIDGLSRKLDNLSSKVDSVGDFRNLLASARKTKPEVEAVTTSVSRLSAGTSGLAELASRVGAAFVFTGALISLQRVTDAATNLENRLRLVLNTQEEVNQAHADLFSIAQKTMSSMNGMGVLYQKLTESGQALNKTSEDTLKALESVSLASQISGSSAESTAAAIMQLNQALGSGVLRGEEYNSVIEQTPRIAKAIADAVGVSIGQLRTLANDGQITSDVVFNALVSQQKTLQKEFNSTSFTVGSAMTAIGTSLGYLVSATDKLVSGSKFVVSALRRINEGAGNTIRIVQDLSQNIGEVADTVVFDSRRMLDGFQEASNTVIKPTVDTSGIVDAMSRTLEFMGFFKNAVPLALESVSRGVSSVMPGLLVGLEHFYDMPIRWLALQNTPAALEASQLNFQVKQLGLSLLSAATGFTVFDKRLQTAAANLGMASSLDEVKSSIGDIVNAIQAWHSTSMATIWYDFAQPLYRVKYDLEAIVGLLGFKPRDGFKIYGLRLDKIKLAAEGAKDALVAFGSAIYLEKAAPGLLMLNVAVGKLLTTLLNSFGVDVRVNSLTSVLRDLGEITGLDHVATGLSKLFLAVWSNIHVFDALGSFVTTLSEISNYAGDKIGSALGEFGIVFKGKAATIRAIGDAIGELAVRVDRFLKGFQIAPAIKAIAFAVVDAISSIIRAVAKLSSYRVEPKGFFGSMVDRVTDEARRLANPQRIVADFLNSVERGFFWVYDRVVGHSWWPDLVDGVVNYASHLKKQAQPKIQSFLDYVNNAFQQAKNFVLSMDFSPEGLRRGLQSLASEIADFYRAKGPLDKLMRLGSQETFSDLMAQNLVMGVSAHLIGLEYPLLVFMASVAASRKTVEGLNEAWLAFQDSQHRDFKNHPLEYMIARVHELHRVMSDRKPLQLISQGVIDTIMSPISTLQLAYREISDIGKSPLQKFVDHLDFSRVNNALLHVGVGLAAVITGSWPLAVIAMLSTFHSLDSVLIEPMTRAVREVFGFSFPAIFGDVIGSVLGKAAVDAVYAARRAFDTVSDATPGFIRNFTAEIGPLTGLVGGAVASAMEYIPGFGLAGAMLFGPAGYAAYKAKSGKRLAAFRSSLDDALSLLKTAQLDAELRGMRFNRALMMFGAGAAFIAPALFDSVSMLDGLVVGLPLALLSVSGGLSGMTGQFARLGPAASYTLNLLQGFNKRSPFISSAFYAISEASKLMFSTFERNRAAYLAGTISIWDAFTKQRRVMVLPTGTIGFGMKSVLPDITKRIRDVSTAADGLGHQLASMFTSFGISARALKWIATSAIILGAAFVDSANASTGSAESLAEDTPLFDGFAIAIAGATASLLAFATARGVTYAMGVEGFLPKLLAFGDGFRSVFVNLAGTTASAIQLIKASLNWVWTTFPAVVARVTGVVSAIGAAGAAVRLFASDVVLGMVTTYNFVMSVPAKIAGYVTMVYGLIAARFTAAYAMVSTRLVAALAPVRLAIVSSLISLKAAVVARFKAHWFSSLISGIFSLAGGGTLAVGGILFVHFFGTGDTFLQKAKSVFRKLEEMIYAPSKQWGWKLQDQVIGGTAYSFRNQLKELNTADLSSKELSRYRSKVDHISQVVANARDSENTQGYLTDSQKAELDAAYLDWQGIVAKLRQSSGMKMSDSVRLADGADTSSVVNYLGVALEGLRRAAYAVQPAVNAVSTTFGMLGSALEWALLVPLKASVVAIELIKAPLSIAWSVISNGTHALLNVLIWDFAKAGDSLMAIVGDLVESLSIVGSAFGDLVSHIAKPLVSLVDILSVKLTGRTTSEHIARLTATPLEDQGKPSFFSKEYWVPQPKMEDSAVSDKLALLENLNGFSDAADAAKLEKMVSDYTSARNRWSDVRRNAIFADAEDINKLKGEADAANAALNNFADDLLQRNMLKSLLVDYQAGLDKFIKSVAETGGSKLTPGDVLFGETARAQLDGYADKIRGLTKQLTMLPGANDATAVPIRVEIAGLKKARDQILELRNNVALFGGEMDNINKASGWGLQNDALALWSATMPEAYAKAAELASKVTELQIKLATMPADAARESRNQLIAELATTQQQLASMKPGESIGKVVSEVYKSIGYDSPKLELVSNEQFSKLTEAGDLVARLRDEMQRLETGVTKVDSAGKALTADSYLSEWKRINGQLTQAEGTLRRVMGVNSSKMIAEMLGSVDKSEEAKVDMASNAMQDKMSADADRVRAFKAAIEQQKLLGTEGSRDFIREARKQIAVIQSGYDSVFSDPKKPERKADHEEKRKKTIFERFGEHFKYNGGIELKLEDFGLASDSVQRQIQHLAKIAQAEFDKINQPKGFMPDNLEAFRAGLQRFNELKAQLEDAARRTSFDNFWDSISKDSGMSAADAARENAFAELNHISTRLTQLRRERSRITPDADGRFSRKQLEALRQSFLSEQDLVLEREKLADRTKSISERLHDALQRAGMSDSEQVSAATATEALRRQSKLLELMKVDTKSMGMDALLEHQRKLAQATFELNVALRGEAAELGKIVGITANEDVFLTGGADEYLKTLRTIRDEMSGLAEARRRLFDGTASEDDKRKITEDRIRRDSVSRMEAAAKLRLNAKSMMEGLGISQAAMLRLSGEGLQSILDGRQKVAELQGQLLQLGADDLDGLKSRLAMIEKINEAEKVQVDNAEAYNRIREDTNKLLADQMTAVMKGTGGKYLANILDGMTSMVISDFTTRFVRTFGDGLSKSFADVITGFGPSLEAAMKGGWFENAFNGIFGEGALSGLLGAFTGDSGKTDGSKSNPFWVRIAGAFNKVADPGSYNVGEALFGAALKYATGSSWGKDGASNNSVSDSYWQQDYWTSATASGGGSSTAGSNQGVSYDDIIGAFDTGGVVPGRIGEAQLAVVHSGETILPTHKGKLGLVGAEANSGGTQQIFNINVTGDISRQTRKEVLQMLPAIASGVNNFNKETGR